MKNGYKMFMYDYIFIFQSEDGTVFFMTIGTTYEPVGFVKMPAAVRSIQWSPENFVSRVFDSDLHKKCKHTQNATHTI